MKMQQIQYNLAAIAAIEEEAYPIVEEVIENMLQLVDHLDQVSPPRDLTLDDDELSRIEALILRTVAKIRIIGKLYASAEPYVSEDIAVRTEEEKKSKLHCESVKLKEELNKTRTKKEIALVRLEELKTWVQTVQTRMVEVTNEFLLFVEYIDAVQEPKRLKPCDCHNYRGLRRVLSAALSDMLATQTVLNWNINELEDNA